jgi:hypothetical protein
MVVGMVDIDQIKSFMVNKSAQRPQISEGIDQPKSSITLAQRPKPESTCPLEAFFQDPFGNAVFSFNRRRSVR